MTSSKEKHKQILTSSRIAAYREAVENAELEIIRIEQQIQLLGLQKEAYQKYAEQMNQHLSEYDTNIL